MIKKFLIYMPTFSRPEVCLQQVQEIHAQIEDFRNIGLDLDINFVVSINCDSSYNEDELSKFTNLVINHPVNYGASINIALGFIYAKKNSFDYLWIVGDDEPIQSNAVKIITRTISATIFDLLIGSKKMTGSFSDIKSYMSLSEMTGGTPSFISSTVYSCSFDLEVAYEALTYEFTSFPHLIVINNFFSNKSKMDITLIPSDDLCKDSERIYKFPKVSRGGMGARDSTVFFGKPLTFMSCKNLIYKKNQLLIWWIVNWHRVSMYYSKTDFRGKLFIAISMDYKVLWPLIYMSKLPIWRLKNLYDLFLSKRDI